MTKNQLERTLCYNPAMMKKCNKLGAYKLLSCAYKQPSTDICLSNNSNQYIEITTIQLENYGRRITDKKDE